MNLDRERTTGARTRSSSGRRGTDDPSRGKAKRPRKHSGGRAKAAATDPSRPRLRIRVYPTARSTDARNNCFFEAVMRSIYYQVGPHHRYARRNPTPEDQAMLRNELADFVEASPGLLELWRIVDAGHADAEAALADRLRNLREEGNQVGEETLLAMALYTNLRFLVLQDTTGGAGRAYTTEHGWLRRYGDPDRVIEGFQSQLERLDLMVPVYLHHHYGADGGGGGGGEGSTGALPAGGGPGRPRATGRGADLRGLRPDAPGSGDTGGHCRRGGGGSLR